MNYPIISLLVSTLIVATFTAGEISAAFVSHHRHYGSSSFTTNARRNNNNRRHISYSRIGIQKLHGMTNRYNSNDDGEKLDLEDLQRRVEEQRQNEQRQTELYNNGSMFTTSPSTDSPDIDKPEDVFIIVYNPDTEEQGVHTLEVPKGSGINFILAFEDEEVCQTFCASLRDQQFFDPKVKEIKLVSLEEYCEDLDDVFVQTIPKGLNLEPPTERVDELDLNPERNMEVEFVDYLYRMSSASADNDIVGSIGNEGDGGALYSNDNGVDGGSWE